MGDDGSEEWKMFRAEFLARALGYLRTVPCRAEVKRAIAEDALAMAFSTVPLSSGPGWMEVRNELRAEARRWVVLSRHEVEDDRTVAKASAPERAPAMLDDAELLERIMRTLTPLERAALELHLLDDLDDSSIAQQCGCAKGSVRVLRFRALAKLRRAFRARADPPHRGGGLTTGAQ